MPWVFIAHDDRGLRFKKLRRRDKALRLQGLSHWETDLRFPRRQPFKLSSLTFAVILSSELALGISMVPRRTCYRGVRRSLLFHGPPMGRGSAPRFYPSTPSPQKIFLPADLQEARYTLRNHL